MYLEEASTGHLVEVLDFHELTDPHRREVMGRYQRGEDLPEAERFAKARLVFPSGEPLPRCWRDPHYRSRELRR